MHLPARAQIGGPNVSLTDIVFVLSFIISIVQRIFNGILDGAILFATIFDL
jgi:hypothetical protein